jgi:uncharacterized membrane protein YphA (DoxX/SURF4 family)
MKLPGNEAIPMKADDGQFTVAQKNGFAILRILFGFIWVMNTWFQAQAAGLGQFMPGFQQALQGEPGWEQGYVQWVVHAINTVGHYPAAVAMVVIDGLLALSLLTGIWLRFFAWVGIVYSLFLWSSIQAFGGPYGPGATDPGPGIVYALGFAFILLTQAWDALSLESGAPPYTTAGDVRGLVVGRVLFGLVWLFDAFWKWQPYFLTHVLSIVAAGQQGEPAWMVAYIQFFLNIIQGIGPFLFAVLTAMLETLIALSMLTGIWIRLFAPIGALFALGIWTTAESWGGPYSWHSTGMPGDVVGNAILYVLLFLFLSVAYWPAHREAPEPAARQAA